jgi:hypothetical protein
VSPRWARSSLTVVVITRSSSSAGAGTHGTLVSATSVVDPLERTL